MAVKENTGQQPPVFVLPQQDKNKLTDLAVKAGLAVLAYWGLKKIITNFNHNQAENSVGTNTEAQQATSLRAAINPSGKRWLWWVDGVDTTAIFNIAAKIKNFKDVIKEYRNLYDGDSLENDLRSKISAEEYNRFLNTVNFSNAEQVKNKSSVNFSAGRVAISKAEVNIRKTPRASGSQTKDKLLVFGRSNIITTVDTGMAIGITTGRTSFDEKAEPSGVLFIEVTILKKDAPIKDSFTAWVAGSQVETFTSEQYKQKRNPALVITKEQYDNASASLNGTGIEPNYRKEIITVSPTHVLNDKFQTVNEAAKNIILGYPIMELKTHNEDYVKFQTIDDTQRWVKKKHTKTIEK